jgi:hypothetical protein
LQQDTQPTTSAACGGVIVARFFVVCSPTRNQNTEEENKNNEQHIFHFNLNAHIFEFVCLEIPLEPRTYKCY